MTGQQPSNSRLDLARKRVEERARAKSDKMHLANDVLGYDFQECHRELFAQYPDFDESKPWAEQIAGYEDILVLWPRGHYKSTALKVVLIQAVLNNPDIPILLMQGNVSLTELFLEEIAKHFRGEVPESRLKELFPEFCGTKKALANNKKSLTVPCRRRTQTPQATFTVASPKSIKTLQHYWLGAFDDLQNESNSTNPVQVEKVYSDFISLQPLVQHGGRWVSGTRWAFGDCYEQIMLWSKTQEQKGVRKWRISVKTCWKEDGSVRFPRFQKRNGQIDGFTREDLLQLLEQRPTWFACQYLNHPVIESQQTITPDLLNSALIAPLAAPALSRAILFLDLAATNETGHSDDCVIVAGKLDSQAKMYVADQRGGLWTTMTFALNVIDMALKHRPSKILIEKSSAGMIFVEFLRVVAREKGIVLPVDFIQVDTKPDAKNTRVGALAGHIKAKRFLFFFGLSCWEKSVEQAIQFPKGRYGHDDWPDTWALMARYFAQSTLFMPMPEVATTRHPVVALLDRDPVTQQIDLMGREVESRDGVGEMGGDFCC